MLASQALAKAQSIQDAAFWRQRAECLEHIARAAKQGSTATTICKSIEANVVTALELMGYKVDVAFSDFSFSHYTRMEWSHAQVGMA